MIDFYVCLTPLSAMGKHENTKWASNW